MNPEAPPSPQGRQFVSFAFHRLLPEIRRLPPEERGDMLKEAGGVLEELRRSLILRSYTLQGLHTGVDFMLWAIGGSMEDIHTVTSSLMKTGLGGYLETPYAYLSMTKRSTYVDRHVHPGQEGRRERIVPGDHRYLFVYPFVKTRAWYALDQAIRQVLMDEHIAVGHRFPTVTLNTTYSYGLDDQEFVLAFETDHPEDFLDLVMALRETKVSQYTLRDTPTFTCMAKPLWQLLEELLA